MDMAVDETKPAETAETEKPTQPERRERPREIVIDLFGPAQAHGEPLKQLKFRRPTGGDIMKLGELPIKFDRNGAISINPSVMGEMMSILAAVPPSTIDRLDSEDWLACSYGLARFFVVGM